MTWVWTPSRSMSASRSSATAGRRALWSWMPARSKRVVDRLDRPRGAGRRRLAVPAAPDLAVADPHRLSVALLDMRRAVAQRGRQPRLPQIRRQLPQIHMVVAGDQSVRHSILQRLFRADLALCSRHGQASHCSVAPKVPKGARGVAEGHNCGGSQETGKTTVPDARSTGSERRWVHRFWAKALINLLPG